MTANHGEDFMVFTSLPGCLQFTCNFPPRNATPLEVRTWLSRWRLDVAHVIGRTYVALNHKRKEVILRREFGWFERAIAKIEITGQELRDADELWLGMRLMEAGFDFHVIELMLRDIFCAKVIGMSLEDNEELKRMKEERMRLHEEVRRKGAEESKQVLQAKIQERDRTLKPRHEILNHKDEISREQEAELESVLSGTAGEGKETKSLPEDATLPGLSAPDRSPPQHIHRASPVESGSSPNINSDVDFDNFDFNPEEVSGSEATVPKTPTSTGKAKRKGKHRRERRLFQKTALTRANVWSAFLTVLAIMCFWVFIVTSRFTTIELFLGVAFWLAFGAKVLMLYLRDFSHASFHDGLFFSDREAAELGMPPEMTVLCLGAMKSNRFCVVPTNTKSGRRDEHGMLMKPLGHRVWEDGSGRTKVYPRKRSG